MNTNNRNSFFSHRDNFKLLQREDNRKTTKEASFDHPRKKKDL